MIITNVAIVAVWLVSFILLRDRLKGYNHLQEVDFKVRRQQKIDNFQLVVRLLHLLTFFAIAFYNAHRLLA